MVDPLYFCFSEKTLESLELLARSISGYIRTYGNDYFHKKPSRIQINRIQSDENEHLHGAYLAGTGGMRTDMYSMR